DRERDLRQRWREGMQQPLYLLPRALDGVTAGRILFEQAARQSPRAEVDRADPRRAVASRPDRDLRGAAADVADGDALAVGAAARRERADEREAPLFLRAEQPHRKPGGARE